MEIKIQTNRPIRIIRNSQPQAPRPKTPAVIIGYILVGLSLFGALVCAILVALKLIPLSLPMFLLYGSPVVLGGLTVGGLILMVSYKNYSNLIVLFALWVSLAGTTRLVVSGTTKHSGTT